MKKIGMLLLSVCLLLSLAACGKNAENKKDMEDPQPTEESQPMDESQPAEESQPMEEPVDEETIEGVINRLDDYLVLLDSDGNYHVFEFGEGVDQKSLAEGDNVKVIYVGVLDQEDPAPVAVSVEKTDG